MAIKNDVIVAIATAPGPSGVGVVRLSGFDLTPFVSGILKKNVLTPRFAELSWFHDTTGDIIDQGLALWFPAPYSYTGEDVLELQGHGSMMVLSSLISACQSFGARLAMPGEFTQRAFFNGKLDLTQAEAVIDLIHADSQACAKGALRSLSGVFSKKVSVLRESLIELRMFIEGSIDFSEEGYDFLATIPPHLSPQCIEEQLFSLLKDASDSLVFNQGRQVVLIGAPNAGKSSILNALSQDDLAIVTEIPGTTRDAIKHQIVVQGIPFHIIDTAGLRETTDRIELVGIEKTWQAIDKADMVLLVIDVEKGITLTDQQLIDRLSASLPIIKVANKIDLLADAGLSDQWIKVSAKTMFGLDELKNKLIEVSGVKVSTAPPFLARERHVAELKTCLHHLRLSQQVSEIEFVAEELRLTQQALNSVTGEFTADDLLGEVFSKFCIGK
ncbi:MAG: tRNA modification GTPase TrmE [Ferrovum sp. 21-44-67]|uniref:tRNA uridine-5-carboxymethylaminomethyl(34) synthesis GTPase MnmE n=1 Tax=Ferrovum sp. JA12 TaxID=1356299 RepID=UPI000703834D|nr:tRNA uridine-5-carboxymethylaminomethyl(34) synthesis GTPase MnmE [Ferrovum sp. JA12]KRH79392.1 tRNA modification GTPase MnmE [Ferrovum sp. JA12]OYV79386.1 MAG: tRNA modification GTPase TrmE [Ferrovum sp. 21-44-67]HQU06760.1 tRNA uridine-5-carboxymethylaminomethyl(34) synthesis GTPase MnmE [Ferrovaceae bacterium]